MSTPTEMLTHMRERARMRRTMKHAPQPKTMSQSAADVVANVMGSWPFVLVQSAVLIAWIAFNATSPERIDPFPFVLLNLLLSFQAAYTAPMIMMSQNRQAGIDRSRSIEDYEINQKAELEIETLHEKIDLLREREIAALTEAVARLTKALEQRS